MNREDLLDTLAGEPGQEPAAEVEEPEVPDAPGEEDKPVPFRVFKERLDKVIEQREESRSEIARLRAEMDALRQQASRTPPPKEDEDEDVDDLTAMHREIKALREEQRQARAAEDQRRAMDRLRAEIAQAVQDSGLSQAEIVREMQTDPRMTAAQAVRHLKDREKAMEARILERLKQKKQKTAPPAPPTSGSTAGAGERQLSREEKKADRDRALREALGIGD